MEFGIVAILFRGIYEVMNPIPYRVRKTHRETRDTLTLELEPSANTTIGSFEPGQFNMLYAFGVGEAPISISGDPAEAGRLVHTIRDVGPVTHALCQAGPGMMIGVRGPFGTHWPVGAAAEGDVLVIAGGLGLAPLRPAFYSLLRRRSDYQRVSLVYGARTPADLLFRRELEKWRSHLDIEVEVTVDSAGGDWRGHVGVVTSLIGRLAFDPARTTAMVCGPELMMRFTAMELMNHGVVQERISVSLERNMRCGLGFCGHCQMGPFFICRDGPVCSYGVVRHWMSRREV